MAYEKTTWADGDVITATGLNNIEGGIEDIWDELETSGNLTPVSDANLAVPANPESGDNYGLYRVNSGSENIPVNITGMILAYNNRTRGTQIYIAAKSNYIHMRSYTRTDGIDTFTEWKRVNVSTYNGSLSGYTLDTTNWTLRHINMTQIGNMVFMNGEVQLKVAKSAGSYNVLTGLTPAPKNLSAFSFYNSSSTSRQLYRVFVNTSGNLVFQNTTALNVGDCITFSGSYTTT